MVAILAGMTRLELATFRVTGGRSNQLSYTPIVEFALSASPKDEARSRRYYVPHATLSLSKWSGAGQVV